MDKDTIKALVIKFRDEDGLSYAQISERLKSDYGVVRDRQALYGLYTRAKNKVDKQPKYGIVLTSEVLNIFALGYNMAQVTHLVMTDDNDINYSKVREIIAQGTKEKNKILEAKACTAVELIRTGASIDEIKVEISYNGIAPTDSTLNSIVAAAYSMIIRNNAMNEITEAYRLTDSKDVIRKICEELDMGISYTDIKGRL